MGGFSTGGNAQEIQGRPISPTAPTTNQVLEWNGSEWLPANASGGITALTGDVSASGTGSVNATVEKLQGYAVNLGTAPTTGQVLEWNGTDWVAATPSAGSSYTPQYLYQSGQNGLSYIAKYDYTSLQVVAFNQEVGYGPGTMAVDPKGVYGYISCGDNPAIVVQKIDLATFQIVDELDSFDDAPTNLCVMDPAGEYLYVAGSTYLFKIALSTFTIVEYNDPTGGEGLGGPNALAIDPAGEYLYVATGGGSSGYVYQVKTSDLSRNGIALDMYYVQSISVSNDSSQIATANGENDINIYSSSSFTYASQVIDFGSITLGSTNYVLFDPNDDAYVWCNSLGNDQLYQLEIASPTGTNFVSNPDGAQFNNAVIDGYGNVISMTSNGNLFRFAFSNDQFMVLPQTQYNYSTYEGNTLALFGGSYNFTLN